MKGGPSTLDVELFPQAVESIGENPARWLDHDLVDDEDWRLMAKARIDGIDYLQVAAVWHTIERRLDRGPRDRVIEWIEDRMAYLEEHGERDDRPRRDPESIPDVSYETVFLDENGEEYERGTSARAQLSSMRADGGEP